MVSTFHQDGVTEMMDENKIQLELTIDGTVEILYKMKNNRASEYGNITA